MNDNIEFVKNVLTKSAKVILMSIAGLVGFFVLVCVLLLILDWADPPPPKVAKVEKPTVESLAPPGLQMRLVNDEAFLDYKRSIDIELSGPVSEEFLREVADDIKVTDKGAHKRLFISYYLPGMNIGEGAWATTHYTPELEVRINDFFLEK